VLPEEEVCDDGCEQDAGTGGTGGTGGTAGASGAGGTAGASGAGGTCGTGGSTGGSGGSVCGNPSGGPAMVELPEGFCIDTTEVTRSQYEVWLATSPSTSGQISDCTCNDSYESSCPWGDPEWPPGSQGDHPVVCVDWCDAYAYCQAVGKHLCRYRRRSERLFGLHGRNEERVVRGMYVRWSARLSIRGYVLGNNVQRE